MGKYFHTALVFHMYYAADIELSSLKQVLAELKRGCLAWFNLLHTQSLLDTKGVSEVLEQGEVTRY